MLTLLAVVLVVLGSSGGGQRVTGPPLSPASVGPDGTKGLVLLLRRLGATVEVRAAAPVAGDTTALLLRDELTGAARRAVRDWVRAGGTLVVADPSSPFAADGAAAPEGNVLQRGSCDLPGVDGVTRILTADAVTDAGFVLDAPQRFAVGAHDESCFGDGDAAYVVRQAEGDGAVISVGGAEPFVNRLLDQADAAALAADLLAPAGTEHVALIEPNPVGGGDKTLGDLIPDRMFQGFLQLVVVAFPLYCLFRARRLGRPTREPLPVTIPGSGLVASTGRLRQRAGGAYLAARDLRADARTRLARAHGLPASADAATIAAVVAARHGLDPDRLRAALDDGGGADEATLVALAREIDTILQEAEA